MQLGAISPAPAHALPEDFCAEVDTVFRSLYRVSWVLLSEQTEKIFWDAARLAAAQTEYVNLKS